MVVNRKVTGKAMSMPGGLALGGLVSIGITVAGAILSANLVLKEVIPADSIGYCSLVILLLSSMLGAAVAVNRIRHRRLYVCALSAVIYYGTLLGATALFFGGRYQGMGVTALVVLAGAGAVALVGTKQNNSRPRHRRK